MSRANSVKGKSLTRTAIPACCLALALGAVPAQTLAQASAERTQGTAGPSVEVGTGTSRGMDSGANPDIEAGTGAGAKTRTSGPQESGANAAGGGTAGSNTGSDRDDADFDVLDTNNDGRLDRDELREGGREHRASDMDGVDGVDRETFYRYQGGQSN